MKQNAFDWYEQNDFPKTVIISAQEITSQVETYYNMEFDTIFISNIQNENNEEYPSLWLFTNQYVVECKNFLTNFDIDIAKYENSIKYINIITDNCDALNNPSQTSTMKLRMTLSNDTRCIFDALGLNCKRLSDIAKHFLKEYMEGK
jgi:hypothetical protein